MALTLNVLHCPDAVPPETRSVSGGEFSIGRGPGNDWVLADPDRHLSKRHCVLTYRHGAWQLADTSTNGTFLNAEAEPASVGAPRTLGDGDRLRLGAYVIEVRLADEATPAGSASAASPFDADRFGGSSGTAQFGMARDNPFAGAADDWDRVGGKFDAPAANANDALFGSRVQPDHSPALEDAFQPRPVGQLPENWDVDEPAAEPPRQQPPAATPAAARLPMDSEGAATLLTAFLEGAGLDRPAPPDPAAAMRALGAAFRATVSGLRAALITRAAIKGEFRIEQTMIRARGNNPLKFSANDDDALAALLGAGRRVDMSPQAAIVDALRDMRLHELATMAAMQVAVRQLLARLDPEALRQAADEGGAFMQLQRKARAWTAFEKLHAELSQALADDFDGVFGRAFARAYEQALAEAAAQRDPPAAQRDP